MSDRNYQPGSLTFKLEELLDYSGAVDYLGRLAGRQQTVSVAPAQDASSEDATYYAHPALVARGTAHTLEAPVGSLVVIDSVEVPSTVHLWVGDTKVEIARERFERAIRLSMGPEIDAINVLLRGLSILIQDDLEVLSLDEDPREEDELA